VRRDDESTELKHKVGKSCLGDTSLHGSLHPSYDKLSKKQDLPFTFYFYKLSSSLYTLNCQAVISLELAMKEE
jgi:hypothetical protein